MEDEIKVGDIVRLKSGGPPMTVSYKRGPDQWTCLWFTGYRSSSLPSARRAGHFPTLALIKVQSDSNQGHGDDAA